MATLKSSKAEYTLGRKIGEGAEGEAYLAVMTRKDSSVTTVVIKKLLRGSDTNEVDIYKRIAHIVPNTPYVASMIDYFVHKGKHYLVLEYVSGQDLMSWLESPPFQIEENWNGYLGIVRQIASGIKFMHDHDIVHRDLKEENILITDTNTIKIIDLGFACLTDEESMTKLTCRNTTEGTMMYVAPEVLARKPRSLQTYKKADVYSFGVIMYELFTGELSYSGIHRDSRQSSMTAIGLHKLNQLPFEKAFPRIRELGMISDRMASLIKKMLAHNYDNRPNMDEVVKVLQGDRW